MTLDEEYKKIMYTIMETREDAGIKIKELEKVGLSRATYESVVYSRHAASLKTVMRVMRALGLEIVVRRKKDWDKEFGLMRPRHDREWGKET